MKRQGGVRGQLLHHGEVSFQGRHPLPSLPPPPPPPFFSPAPGAGWRAGTEGGAGGGGGGGGGGAGGGGGGGGSRLHSPLKKIKSLGRFQHFFYFLKKVYIIL